MTFDPRRLQADFDRFASIGAGPGAGVTRLALSEADREARALLIRLLREMGLSVRIDSFGNIWGRTDDRWDEPAVIAGSHLDTVPGGGTFDGAVGVVAGLEVVRSLMEEGFHLPVPLGVVSFTSEEASRYGVATIGSKGVAGLLTEAEIYALRDRGGITFSEALHQHAGYDLIGGPASPGAIGCFLELHVEQGRELESAGLPLGVVTAIAAPTRYKVTIHGEAAHSGATPLRWRKDGLAAAADLVLALEEIARTEEEFGTIATANLFSLQPVSINVVPGKVEIGADIRGIDPVHKRRAVAGFAKVVERVSIRRGIPMEIAVLCDEEPVVLDPAAVNYMQAGCKRIGARFQLMPSRGGHDAMNMARRWPSAMLFVPSRDGISHHPNEYTSPAQVELGARALQEAMKTAAVQLGRDR